MNTKHPLHKEKLRVQRELDELNKIQRNQNWIELEHPYKSGYYKEYDLRDDIKNRQDAWVFFECIKLVGRVAWWKDRSFKRKLGKGKYEYILPGFGLIKEEVYISLHPAVKKYFSEINPWHKNYNPFRKSYECVVPFYYFVEKITPRWITHYKEFDSVIIKRENELEDYLSSKKFWGIGWRSGSNAPKDFRKTYHRSDRLHSKQTIYKNLMCDDEFGKYEHRYNHRHSARWDFW